MKGSYLEQIFSAKTHSNEAKMLIGEVASITGASCKAIRHYEKLGIIPQARRRGCYRVYSDLEIFLIHMIKAAQSLGFTLQELRQLAQVKARENEFPVKLASVLLDQKRESVKSQIIALQALEKKLQAFKEEMLHIFA